MPVGFSLLCVLLGIVLLRWSRKAGVGFVLAGVLVLYLFSIAPVAKTLMRTLEVGYPAVAIAELPQADAIVVLGGGILNPTETRIEVEFDDAGDRLHYASKLFKAGKAPILVVSGGDVFPTPGRTGNAEASQSLLIDWGVPAEKTRLDTNSRNTYENARNTAGILGDSASTILLVTSGFHMRRSVPLFEAQGFRVIPASTDVKSGEYNQPRLIDWLPDVYLLHMSTRAINEYLGYFVYKHRGWISE